ncbi:ABC transporter A family member 7 [Acorus calamus]|uniref:ABC transporter A family member 7 n=1 Tax=Acorus calamus TaxID=4465 RepID=A0AAV9DCD6_ACOCL|nr:ABC transporter A family member 7 [Acorus calamus]
MRKEVAFAYQGEIPQVLGGLYELGQYSFEVDLIGTDTIGWKDIMLNSENYAMRDSEIVEKLLMEPNENYHVICHNPRKVYQGRDENPDKVAVEGLMASTSGTTYVQGLDISKDMDEVYTSMGVCPHHEKTLSGREHQLHFGRLKNLKGATLENAVTESLKKVNLHDKEVADKLAGAYSGGMKRRLSVAISLIGNPRVCRS